MTAIYMGGRLPQIIKNVTSQKPILNARGSYPTWYIPVIGNSHNISTVYSDLHFGPLNYRN